MRQWADSAAATARPPPVENTRNVRMHWGRAEVLRQMLWHNVHYNDSNNQGRRSDARSEEEMKEWTRQGIMTVRDVLNTGGDDVMTEMAFAAKWPQLDVNTYAEMLVVMPDE